MKIPTETLKASQADAASTLAGTSGLFLGLCLYMGTQAFTIPVLAVGPWAVWPTLSDIACVLLFLFWLLRAGPNARLGLKQKRVTRALATLIGIAAASYFAVTLLRNHLHTPSLFSGSSVVTGAYIVGRLVQFALLFWIVSSLPFSPRRVRILRRIAYAALVIVVGFGVLTYTGLVSTADLSPWLPRDLESAGPWTFYSGGFLQGQGVSTIGYNHGYTALQILMLLGIILQFGDDTSGRANLNAIALAAVGVFVSGSGAGLIGLLVFAFTYLSMRPLNERLLALFGGASIAAGFVAISQSINPQLNATLIRAAQRLNVFSYDSDVLSGRPEIWAQVIEVLLGKPDRLLYGHGVGSASEVIGTNAHSMPLQLLIEFGLPAFAFMVLSFVGLLRLLKSTGRRAAPMYWITVALLVTSLTQETFYPVPAFGHFLGLYLVAIATTLNAVPLGPSWSVAPSAMGQTPSPVYWKRAAA